MSEKDENFRVIDRRRFDAKGEERNEGEQRRDESGRSSPGEAAASPRREGAAESGKQELPPRGNTGPDERGGNPDMDFSSFIMSLGTQAMMYLGDLKPPEGMQVQKDPDAARHMIDVIDMLHRKTRGNLDPQEEKFIQEILHNLRLRYLAATK